MFIRAYGVNVAVVDDFIFVNGFTQLFTGTLSPEFFIGLHNGHCLFFGKILMLFLGVATHFNIIAEMYLSWLFLCLALSILAYLLIHTLGRKLSSLLLLAPVSFLIFSLRPWDVFLNGSVFLNSMTIFMTLTTIVLLSQSKSDRLTGFLMGSLLCAFLATFSGSASGLLIWPIGLLQLMPCSGKAQDIFSALFRHIGTRLWMVASTLCIGIYVGLILLSRGVNPHPAGASVSAGLVHHLSMMPPYLMILLGSPFGTAVDVMPILGLIALAFYLLATAFYLIMRPVGKEPGALRAAISIFLFGALAVALITYGRSERGALEATATRYVQFSNLMLIGIYLCLCFCEFKKSLLRGFLFAVVLGLIATTAVVGYAAAPSSGMFWRNLQLKNAYVLRNYKIQADADLSALQSNPFFVRHQAAALERYKLNVFSRAYKNLDDVPRVPGEPTYCLDAASVGNMTRSKKSGMSVAVSGWALDGNSKRPARRVALLIDDKIIIPACYGLSYPGVAETFHEKALSDCGLFASFSPTILSAGVHSIQLVVESTDGQHIQVSKPVLSVDVN